MEHSIPWSEWQERWTEEDRIKVSGFRVWDSDRCPNCGTFPSEWLGEDGRILRDPPYVTEVIACQGCRDVAETQEQLKGGDEDPGLRVKLVHAQHGGAGALDEPPD